MFARSGFESSRVNRSGPKTVRPYPSRHRRHVRRSRSRRHGRRLRAHHGRFGNMNVQRRHHRGGGHSCRTGTGAEVRRTAPPSPHQWPCEVVTLPAGYCTSACYRGELARQLPVIYEPNRRPECGPRRPLAPPPACGRRHPTIPLSCTTEPQAFVSMLRRELSHRGAGLRPM